MSRFGRGHRHNSSLNELLGITRIGATPEFLGGEQGLRGGHGLTPVIQKPQPSIVAETSRPINAGCAVQVLAEPELEHQERPEPGAVLAAAVEVLGDQGADGLGAEEAPIESGPVEQDRTKLFLELARNQRPTGTPKPILGRVRIGGGKRSANARLSTTLERPGRNLNLRSRGMAAASSTTRWSRNGALHSRLCAMLARSTLTNRSPGR